MAYSAGRTEGKEGGKNYVGMEIVMEVKFGIPTLNLLRMNHDCEGKVGCIASPVRVVHVGGFALQLCPEYAKTASASRT